MDKVCKECGGKLVGRSDAKFCSDQCRSSFNNKENGYQSSFVRRINATLRRNRKILLELNTDPGAEYTASDLGRKGFDFEYCTSTYIMPGGEIYKYCYDQGYIETSPDVFKLVAKNDDD